MAYSFHSPKTFTGDFFVSDYTNYKVVNQTPSEGVDIRDNVLPIFEEWPPLCFLNPNSVSVLTANMENNPAICKRANGTMSKQCECLCISTEVTEDDIPWFALVELKCCEKDSRDVGRNIESELQKAIVKLKEHHQLLRDEKGLIDKGKQRYYWVISIPTINKPPFSSFLWTQDYMLAISEQYDGARVIADNEILIVDGCIIKGTH
jgi:hypothetical protein